VRVEMYDDPAAVLVLEEALRPWADARGVLPRCPHGQYEAMGAVEGCCVHLLHDGRRPLVHLRSFRSRPCLPGSWVPPYGS